MRRLRALLPIVVLALSYCVLDGAGTATARPGATSWTGHQTVTRSFLDAAGKSDQVDSRSVTLAVSQTNDLRGRQEITVSWSGAHPTGGLVADLNSGDAARQEYPFVLLECRGIDSASAGSRQLTPETCWTQSAGERFQKDNSTGYPAWRSDRYETTADRAALVDAADPRPAACYRAALAERWVPFRAVNGTEYEGGSGGCAGQAPESANVSGTGIPSNTTYGVTGADGKGSTDFDVWTSDENASLGCTDKVACALVAVPIEGISCDAYGTELPVADQPPARRTADADSACRASGQYKAGASYDPGIEPDVAVTGALWWSASNWRNRITVPLNFAVPASECAVVSGSQPAAIYGSVLMSELTAQWEPTFCTDPSLYPFVHVQTSDAAARNLLASGGIDAAFTSRISPKGYGRPVVQAPVALTGFAISYAIDDAHGDRYRSLRLDARLLAKLLTESYPGNGLVRDNYPALAGNPMNITQDPEFVALNPGLPHYSVLEAASTLSMLSSDADLAYALTSYLDSDAESRAWLNGEPDPWGMVVNPSYLKIALPLESWPLLDDFQLPQSYVDSQNNPCYSYSPAPYLQLIANPSNLLSTIVSNLQFAISNVNITCPNGIPGDIPSLRLSVQGRQQPGHRFVLGVSSVSAARRYDLDTAKLQTSLVDPDLTGRFSDASGRTFVAPDDAGLRAAGALLSPDTKQDTWTLDYSQLVKKSGAYPGAMPVYADIPTVGLSKASGQHLATFLRYASKDGQQAGLANGQLPAGYLPMTKANGLGALADYTARSAAAVAAQAGAVPPLKAPAVVPTHSPTPDPTTSSAPPTSASTEPVVPTGAGNGSVPTVPVVAQPSAETSTPASPTATSSSIQGPVSVSSGAPGTVNVRSAAFYSRLGSLALPIVVTLGLFCGLLGSLLRYPALPGAAVAGIRRSLRRSRRGRRRR